MYDIKDVERVVKNTVSKERYYHSVCTAEACESLAKLYKVDVKKAKLIGIAHDIAREMPEKEKLEYIKANKIYADEIEKKRTGLLHAKIGADICKKEFGFTNDMKDAIEAHTTGKLDMDILSKILFIADCIGDDRKWDDVNLIKAMVKKDINQAVIYVLDVIIKDMLEKGKVIHPDSILARNGLIF